MTRREDFRFLTGGARFTEDISLSGEVHGHVLRSPHAHAAIRAINPMAALDLPGVLAILTAADLTAEGVGSLPCVAPLKGGFAQPPRLPLAEGRVRHVGDPIAFVVAETPLQARDGAELIDVDYAPLPCVTDGPAALAEGAPEIWPEAPGNLCFDWEAGDGAAVEAAFAQAARLVELEVAVNRLVVASLETRAAIGVYDTAAARYTLYTPSQGAHMIRNLLCAHVLKIPLERLRVITPDVGGAFGMKLFPYPEQALVLIAARRLGRPVKWLADRSEAFLSDTQARDHVTRAALAVDGAGRFLALKAEVVANLGAYLSAYGVNSPTAGVAKILGNTYHIPALHLRVRGVFTNTVSMEAYRGAGKPEICCVIERLVDHAAGELGLDPLTLRRRNLIPAAAMPYRTGTGHTYEDCDFAANLDGVLAAADREGFAARRRESEARGRLRGFGLGTYLHFAAGMPGDMGLVRFEVDGGVTAFAGTQASGQGHETALAKVVAEHLGLDADRVRVVEGDSDALARGAGSGGSGTLLTSGVSLIAAADKAIESGIRVAAHLLEAAAADLEYRAGAFRVAGTDRELSLAAVAAAAIGGDLPEDLPRVIEGSGRVDLAPTTYPSGAMACEVEIDPETGAVSLVRLAAWDDYGRIVDRAIVAGQVHGAIAQGVGQALTEACLYEPESGQLLTGSFMDYGLPRADDLPALEVHLAERPSAANPLGAKGVGELGTIGAPGAVMNAVLDALRPLGVRHLDMPATPERVWRAIRAAAQA